MKAKNTPPLLDLNSCLLSPEQADLLDGFDRYLPALLEAEANAKAAMEAAEKRLREAELYLEKAKTGEAEDVTMEITEELIQAMLDKGELELAMARGRAKQAARKFQEESAKTSEAIKRFMENLQAERFAAQWEKAAQDDIEQLFRTHLARVSEPALKDFWHYSKKRGFIEDVRVSTERLKRLSPYDRGDKVLGPIKHVIGLLRMSPNAYCASRGGRW
jgi:site-specific recombinase XerD